MLKRWRSAIKPLSIILFSNILLQGGREGDNIILNYLL
jgi:hypothetical protein